MTRRWLAVLIGVLAIAAAQSSIRAQASSETDQNSALVARHLELVNRGQLKEAAEMFAPDVRHHLGNWPAGREGIVTGRQTLLENLEDISRTFPDRKTEILEMVSEGESVVIRCRVSGTHQGIATKRLFGGFLLGAQPTGRRFEVQHIHWYKIRDGKITDHFANRDDLGMMQQLGFLPGPQPVGKDK